jgi:hypothetical protein
MELLYALDLLYKYHSIEDQWKLELAMDYIHKGPHTQQTMTSSLYYHMLYFDLY